MINSDLAAVRTPHRGQNSSTTVRTRFPTARFKTWHNTSLCCGKACALAQRPAAVRTCCQVLNRGEETDQGPFESRAAILVPGPCENPNLLSVSRRETGQNTPIRTHTRLKSSQDLDRAFNKLYHPTRNGKTKRHTTSQASATSISPCANFPSEPAPPGSGG